MQRKWFILFCFFLSGAAGLMYEIIWTRYFSLTFGATTYSITTVLTAFMAGLALGSLLLGKVADRIRDRLALYGWIELLIGLYALCFPLIYRLSTDLYLHLIGPGEIAPVSKLVLKFVLSFLIMLVPTTLMGGSLPILSRHLIEDLKGVSSKLGILYAINTFGAVVGTYLVGFHLLATIGLKASILVAALINMGIGIGMILYARTVNAAEMTTRKEAPAEVNDPVSRKEKRVILFAVCAFMISGFVSLSHEVVWTRILSLIIGSSTYAFTMILIGFLVGIALGSYLISHTKLIASERINLVMFSWIEIGIGISAFALIPLFSKLPYIMIKAFQINPESYRFITFYQFVLSLCIVIIPTTLMGATLPVIGKIVSREVRSVGSSIGNIYFFNTFGAIFGSFFAGFLFIPYLGTLNTLKLGIAINLILGIGGLLLAGFQNKKRGTLLLSLLIASAGLSAVWFSNWDTRLMDLGASIYGQTFAKEAKKNIQFKNGSKVLYLEEGINATITVRQAENAIFLKTNGKIDASTNPRGDMITQTFSGYLPMMLHPNPRNTLVIGLASGVTAWTVAQYDEIQSLDIVEIEPSMVEAASFFEEVNYNVMADPKSNLIINDGRNHLLETTLKYDLIISEPSNPWISGIGSLYTTDYFKIVNEKLNSGGIFCQWLQAYSLSLENLKMILHTLTLSFEDIQLWISNASDILLICSNKKIDVDVSRIDHIMNFNERTKTDFSRYLLADQPMELLGRLFLDRSAILAFSQGAKANSDNYPYLEFLAPKDLYISDQVKILQQISELHAMHIPGPIQELSDKKNISLASYHRSKVYSDVTFRWYEIAKHYAREAIALDDSREDYYFQLGKVLIGEMNYGKSEEVINRGLEIKRTSKGLELFESLLHTVGKKKEALNFLEQNRTLMNKFEKLYGNRLYEMENYKEAIPHLEAALQLKQGRAYLLAEKLGKCYESVGQLEKAENYYKESIQMVEMNPRSQFYLAELYYHQERFEDAINIYSFITQYWEYSRFSYERLADCYAKLGQDKKAKHIIEKVLPKVPEPGEQN